MSKRVSNRKGRKSKNRTINRVICKRGEVKGENNPLRLLQNLIKVR